MIKKIINPREYIESNDDVTLESYIHYLKSLREECELLDESDDKKDMIDQIDHMMKSVEVNLSILMIHKINDLQIQGVLKEQNINTLYDLNCLLILLQSTGMHFIPEDLASTLSSRVETLTTLLKKIHEEDGQIRQKNDDCQFLVSHINSSELIEKACIQNDGLLIDTFGSLAEKAKPFLDAETRRLTQITMMAMYMKKLEDLQEEYYSIKNRTTNIFDKMKKEYKNSLKAILDKYNAVLQEAIDYFNAHPEILCVAPSNEGIQVPKLETFSDLAKASIHQRFSMPSKSDFMEVKDLFREDEFCLAFNVIRQGLVILFKFERDDDGFYTFALTPDFRYRLLAAQRVLCSYFKEVYERRLEREEEIKNTPRLIPYEQEIYDRFCSILGFSPTSTEDLVKKITELNFEISKLMASFSSNCGRFVLLCGDPISYPPFVQETVDDCSAVEELFEKSLSRKVSEDQSKRKILAV